MANKTMPGRSAHSRSFRLHLSGLAAALGLAVGLFITGHLIIGQAHAADDRPQLAQTDELEWQSECRDSRCAVSRAMFDPESEQRVAALTFLFEEGQTGSVLVMTAPLGVAIAPGFQLVTGETTIDASIQVCLPDGCQATHRLTEVELSRLGELESVDFRYFPFGRGDQPLNARVPMGGLAEAVEGLSIR